MCWSLIFHCPISSHLFTPLVFSITQSVRQTIDSFSSFQNRKLLTLNVQSFNLVFFRVLFLCLRCFSCCSSILTLFCLNIVVYRSPIYSSHYPQICQALCSFCSSFLEHFGLLRMRVVDGHVDGSSGNLHF